VLLIVKDVYAVLMIIGTYFFMSSFLIGKKICPGMLFTIFKIFVLFLCFQVIYLNFRFVASRILNYRVWKNIKGRWIMITGATDGIGKEMALILAKMRQNIIIVGRNAEKLAATQAEISKLTQCKSILMDFAVEQSFDDVITDNIGMLINNAGVSSEYTKDFVDEERITQIINVNNLNAIKLTQSVLKKMDKYSYIINIGSKVADFPCPLHVVYAASKRMLKSWSVSLAYELNHRYIHVEYISPHFVATKMSKIRKSNLFVPSAHDFAKSVVESVGTWWENTPYFYHVVQNLFLMFIPEILIGYAVYFKHSHIQKLALRKKNR
ncbi:17 beta-hydroxysteroid dehydrogenase type 3, HSD17B3, partial [Trachipleistophora hominis]